MSEPREKSLLPKYDFRSFTYSWRYAIVGAILGFGSPYGLFLLRFYGSFRGELELWLNSELNNYKWTYLYTGVGTILVFAIFGYLIGKRNDALDKLTKSMQASAQTLERLSITDGLTNLYGHSYLITRLEEEFLRSTRYRYPLSCLFIDVDDFKSLNDQHGHLFGDKTLIEIAKGVSSEMRNSDILGRYGGDEFMVILPQTDKSDAYKIAERIRERVAATELIAPGGSVYATISIGVFGADSLTLSSKNILDMADQALRQAKQNGKNQSLLLEGKIEPKQNVSER